MLCFQIPGIPTKYAIPSVNTITLLDKLIL